MDFNASGERAPTFQGDNIRHILINGLTSPQPSNTGLIVAIVACIVVSSKLISSLIKYAGRPKLPVVNGTGNYKENYRTKAKSLIQQGFEKFKGPFYFTTDIGAQIMLPPEYIEAVNKEESLSFTGFTREHFLSHLNTFRNFRPTTPGLFEEAVMKGLTRNLPLFTTPLSREMASCLEDTWGESKEWHEVEVRGDVLAWVARLSARIFAGPTLSANKEWLDISVRYTVNAFQAVQNVKNYPWFLWRLAEWWDPLCRTVREDYKTSKELLAPLLAERNTEIAAAKREGRKPNVPDDSIEWFRNAAHGRAYEDTDIQLGLSIAAIHTTSDLIGQTVLNLCKYPEVIQPLREEAIRVLSKYGWQKVALTEVRLLDSFLKETQRQKPIGMVSMHRLATRDVELPGGLRIQKGQHMGISSHRMWSSDVYENPEEFDPARFLKRRQIPEFQHSSHFVSTSRDHLGFSHGKHACPGRFFAANEVKIAVIHLVLKYDLEMKDTTQAKWFEMGVSMTTNPFAKINVRRRQEEIDIKSFEMDVA